MADYRFQYRDPETLLVYDVWYDIYHDCPTATGFKAVVVTVCHLGNTVAVSRGLKRRMEQAAVDRYLADWGVRLQERDRNYQRSRLSIVARPGQTLLHPEAH
jgi:hypothetical protein